MFCIDLGKILTVLQQRRAQAWYWICEGLWDLVVMRMVCVLNSFLMVKANFPMKDADLTVCPQTGVVSSCTW